MPSDDLDERLASPPTDDDRSGLQPKTARRGLMAVCVAALICMKVFWWSPNAVENREREEKLQKDLIQLEKDARAGKTGKALQYLVTGDRSLLEAAKRERAGPQPAVKEPGDPRPPRQP